jgi:hypothetical protein
MYQYQLWVRLNELSTTNTVVYADNDWAARQLGESMYGAGNVLSYTRIS